MQPNRQPQRGSGNKEIDEDKLMGNKEMEEELNAIRNSLALILQSAVVKKRIPPQAQQNLIKRADRIVDRLQRRNKDDDDRQIIMIMMMLRIVEQEDW